MQRQMPLVIFTYRSQHGKKFTSFCPTFNIEAYAHSSKVSIDMTIEKIKELLQSRHDFGAFFNSISDKQHNEISGNVFGENLAFVRDRLHNKISFCYQALTLTIDEDADNLTISVGNLDTNYGNIEIPRNLNVLTYTSTDNTNVVVWCSEFDIKVVAETYEKGIELLFREIESLSAVRVISGHPDTFPSQKINASRVIERCAKHLLYLKLGKNTPQVRLLEIAVIFHMLDDVIKTVRWDKEPN